MYVDEETQSLYVWLTDDGRSLAPAVQRILSTPGYSDLAELTPVALPAQYSFTQLYAWHEQMADVLSTEGVVFTAIDDQYNRLAVAVQDPSFHGPAVRAQLSKLGIPLEAVAIVQKDSPVDFAGENQRPVWTPIGLALIGICSVGLFAIHMRRRGHRLTGSPSPNSMQS